VVLGQFEQGFATQLKSGHRCYFCIVNNPKMLPDERLSGDL